MKKAVILSLLFLAYTLYSSAQNVGIGAPAPSARLTVSGSETTLNGQEHLSGYKILPQQIPGS